jgi:hypothetical protein
MSTFCSVDVLSFNVLWCRGFVVPTFYFPSTFCHSTFCFWSFVIRSFVCAPPNPGLRWCVSSTLVSIMTSEEKNVIKLWFQFFLQILVCYFRRVGAAKARAPYIIVRRVRIRSRIKVEAEFVINKDDISSVLCTVSRTSLYH